MAYAKYMFLFNFFILIIYLLIITKSIRFLIDHRAFPRILYFICVENFFLMIFLLILSIISPAASTRHFELCCRITFVDQRLFTQSS